MKKKLLTAIILCGIGCFLAMSPVMATNPWIDNEQFCKNPNIDAAYKEEIGCNTNADANVVVVNIINVVISVVAAIAILMIVIGGINLASSAGDPTRAKKGRETILYSAIGLVVALMAFVLVNFVLNGAFN